jgi:hypothetical protein
MASILGTPDITAYVGAISPDITFALDVGEDNIIMGVCTGLTGIEFDWTAGGFVVGGADGGGGGGK